MTCTSACFFFLFRFMLLFYGYKLFVYMYVCVLCSCLVPKEARRRHQTPRTGVTDSRELPCGCLESNPRLLWEWQVLLNTEPTLQPRPVSFLVSGGWRVKGQKELLFSILIFETLILSTIFTSFPLVSLHSFLLCSPNSLSNYPPLQLLLLHMYM